MSEEQRSSQKNGSGNEPPAAAAALAVMNSSDMGVSNIEDDLAGLQSRSRPHERIFVRLPADIRAHLVDERVFWMPVTWPPPTTARRLRHLTRLRGRAKYYGGVRHHLRHWPREMVGRRMCLRATADEMLYMVLKMEPSTVKTLCLKSDINMPRGHWVLIERDTPSYVLTKGICCFTRAKQLGFVDCKFHKGRSTSPTQRERKKLVFNLRAKARCVQNCYHSVPN